MTSLFQKAVSATGLGRSLPAAQAKPAAAGARPPAHAAETTLKSLGTERPSSTASLPGLTTGGHSFGPCTKLTLKNKCAVCSGKVAEDGFFFGLSCSTCNLTLHEACRGLAHDLLCPKPRVSSVSFAELPAFPGDAPPADQAVSSPRGFQKVKHISFKMGTGKFVGLDVQEEVALFFGAPLTGQPRLALEGYQDRVPLILVLLANELKRRKGFEAEGIFRVSAEGQAVERARDCLNVGQGIDALDGATGPHVIAALIKDWFRSLPQGDALLNRLSQAELARACKPDTLKDDATFHRLLNTDAVIQEPYRSTFNWVLDIMVMVCAEETKNRMSDRAVSIVFAPSLWEAPADIPPLQAMNSVKDVAVMIAACVQFLKRRKPLRSPLNDSPPV
jgi:hypothetical protein